MQHDFQCPNCTSNLNLYKRIIFAVENEKGEGGLMLLDPRLGHYDKETHPGYHILEGEKVKFMCPVCHDNLAATDINENLVKVLMVDENRKQHEVYFSRVNGEKSTYWVAPDGIKMFGKDSERYLNNFKSSPRYSGLI